MVSNISLKFIEHRFIVMFVLDSHGLHSKKLNIFYGQLNVFKHFVYCEILFSFENLFNFLV